MTEQSRPLVAEPPRKAGVWIFAAIMVVVALVMVITLERRRAALVNRPLTPSADITAPADIQIPDLPRQAAMPETVGAKDGFVVEGPVLTMPGTVAGRPTVPANMPRTMPGVSAAPRMVGRHGEQTYAPPSTVTLPPVPQPLPSPAAQPPAEAGSRIMASRLANPALTVLQGATIQAVLETALDSNRPGYARAVVAREVRGFDGSKVLIQRGSKLFGEYQNDVAQGQSHIAINWVMLTRPDGVQIALNSPVTGALGQAGVKGKVNSHFLSRFGGMLLQSSLDVGVGLATRSATNGAVILGLPGSTTSVGGGVQGDSSVKPTITVRQGTPIAVLVTHDLDFSTVEP